VAVVDRGRPPGSSVPGGGAGVWLELAWLAGVAVAVGVILWIGAAGVAGAVAASGWAVVAVVGLRGVALVGAGCGWFFLFPPAVRPAVQDCVLIRFLREGANALLPITQIGGEAIGARALALSGAPAALAAASVIVDVLVQATTQFLFALAGLAALAAMRDAHSAPKTIAITLVAAAPALVGFFLAQRPIARRWITRLLARLASGREWLAFAAIDALYARLADIHANRRGVAAAVLTHSCVWLFGALEVWATLAFMGYPCGYPEALVIESLMHAVKGAAFVIPGALGAQEGALLAICAIFGVPAEAALALSLIKRVPDLVFGVPGLIAWQAIEGRALEKRAAAAESGPAE
jgi:putative membrane protein